MIEMLVVVYAALLGAIIGSFLNVCVHRWPLDQSVVSPRSRCPRCGNEIRWYDNIPIVSWLVLRGRCRNCGEGISVRYPLVELAVALIWGGAMLVPLVRDGYLGVVSIGEAVRLATFLTILLGIALTDAEHYIIPDEFSLGGLVIGTALCFLPGGITPMASILGAFVGFGLLWLIAVLGEAAFRKPAMGGGDIKMMAMIGAFIGWQGVLLTIFLALGATVTAIWGEAIIGWYSTAILGL